MIQLNYKTYGEGFPVVILHGLLGSLDNWQSIARKLSSHYKVLVPDQRNHGRSPHTEAFGYQLLVDDLLDFFGQQGIAQAHIIGHSMGGKAAMLFAMQHPAMVKKLVVVDVAPVRYDDRHSHIFHALLSVDFGAVHTREEVEAHLRAKLLGEAEATIQFLMKGLHRNESNGLEWKFNAQALFNAYSNISGEVAGVPFQGETLFVKGALSNYILPAHLSAIAALFPNHKQVSIENAGHWVHAENPNAFLEVVEGMINDY